MFKNQLTLNHTLHDFLRDGTFGKACNSFAMASTSGVGAGVNFSYFLIR